MNDALNRYRRLLTAALLAGLRKPFIAQRGIKFGQ